MPRTSRASVGGICYHVINRGNARRNVFHNDGDYEAFLKAMAHACVEIPMPVLGFCLMPNHFHLALWPTHDGDLSRWMHWLMNAHVRRYHKFHGSSGHLWQGRFKAFPIADDDHLLTVLRYIERNPLRAGLVSRAENWRWGSASCWKDGGERPAFLATGPVDRGKNWLKWVHQAITDAELEAIRLCANRGTPYGSIDWVQHTAKRLAIESTLRPRGRPKKKSQV